MTTTTTTTPFLPINYFNHISWMFGHGHFHVGTKLLHFKCREKINVTTAAIYTV